MGRTKRPQVALYLDPEIVELLDQLSARTGATKQELLRDAVNEMLHKQTDAPRGYEWVRERLPDGRGNRHILRKILAPA